MTTIWGSITIYVTSYLNQYDKTLTMGKTDIIFPLTITTCAIFMQIGQLLMDRLHPKLQMGVGTALFAVPVFFCQYVTNFYAFMFLYSFVLGLGFGTIYMLPIRNAWLFFPEKKGTVSGIILCAKSLGAVCWSQFAEYLANPHELRPMYIVVNGKDKENLFGPDTEVVKNVPKMFLYLSLCYMTLAVGATLLVTKKKIVEPVAIRQETIGSLIRSQVEPGKINDTQSNRTTGNQRTFSGNPLLPKHQTTENGGGNLSFFEDPNEKEKRVIETTVKKHPLYYMTIS